MKKLLFVFICLLSNMLNAQVFKTIYIDFGPNDGVNGNITANPDINNNYWNNCTNPNMSATLNNLIDKDNNITGFKYNISLTMISKGILDGG